MGKKIIMSWSKCKIEVGKTGDDEAMAASLTDIGTINDKSTTLATEDGETLTAIPFEETRNYVQRVRDAQAMYRKLYDLE